jgi:hypothetical protein
MQTSDLKQRDENGRRAAPDRRHEELRSGNERRDEINRREDVIGVMDPEDRSNDERRIIQQRSEARRKNFRRSERERRN